MFKNESGGDRKKSRNPRNRKMTLTMIKDTNQKNLLTSIISKLKNGTNHKIGSQTAPNLHHLSGGTICDDAGHQKPILTTR